jgi:acyl carrier protein
MTEASGSTLELVREAVSRVRQTDFAAVGAADSLNLDSVDRIGLIAELENVFGIELPPDAIEPEVFESLQSLSALIDSRR